MRLAARERIHIPPGKAGKPDQLKNFLAWLKAKHLPNHWIKAYVSEWFKRNNLFFDQRDLVDAGWRPPFTPAHPGGDIGPP